RRRHTRFSRDWSSDLCSSDLMGKMAKLKKLLHAPFTLHAQLLNYIDNEIAYAQAGKPAQIIVKVNALTEMQLINKLYEASQAGRSEERRVGNGLCSCEMSGDE